METETGHDAESTDPAPPFSATVSSACATCSSEADLALLAEAVDENLAAPGPWANDYTPQGADGSLLR